MKLTRVMELEEKISSTRDELESLRAKATAPSASKLDGLPRGRATTSRVEMTAIKIEAAERVGGDGGRVSSGICAVVA